ncbi:TonB-dependent siderophore receptor [Leclercia pneumoniae]|uniref:TonB-dependent siderophore receptor n=1 Tax=Leclercia pneumoniae TaxID=2815358 RepID=A0ABX8JTB9_9ENTR|nr:TonB-dependent siderophore receptor [Leclercia pneumoniae]QSW36438.1 TonB-dependent siderophore receptor [Leclercia pneumoniae]QWW78644.1 TonB-dependent siderophore receptor [Leclercia pneumoniae]
MNNTRKLNKTLLALAIGAVTHSAWAAVDPKEETIVVQAAPTGEFKPGGDLLVPAFLDGQVANGGRLGMLGQQNAMDVPFNIISYTSKLVEDQQARTIGDVVSNDAGVQPLQGYGNYAESFRIRGLKFDGDDMTFGGLSGVLPRQVVDAQMVDRIEIFKGSNALMNGAASSGVGGMINLEPKHAGDIPQVKLGMDYTSDAQIGTTADAGRRFGDSDQFGARVNLVHREGDTAIDNDRRRTTLASVGLDYKGDKFRTSVDMGYQKKTFHGGETGLNIMYVDFVPSLPKNDRSYSQKWAWSDVENEFGMWRSEYDINDSWTAYTELGAQHAHELGLYSAPRLQDESGNATASHLDTNRISDTMSGMAGIRGNFDTGFVSHKVNLGYSAQTKEEKTAWKTSKLADNPLVNIYHPYPVNPPVSTNSDGKGGNYSDPITSGRTRTQGWLLSDTLGVLDDKLLFTLGARHQKVVVRGYDKQTGQENLADNFDGSRWIPVYGIVYKPLQELSLYANHTESLQPGKAAPNTAVNYGQSTGIVHSKQNEVGVKADFGRVGGSLSLFEITMPVSTLNSATKVYSLNAEQRNRGVELSVFGEPMLGLRLNGGATWLQAELTKTSTGLYEGNDAIGVPNFYAVLGAEYDIKPVEGLTAIARVNHSGSQYANQANTKKLDSYTTLDLGVRYRVALNNNQNQMTVRAGVENVTDENYWAGADDSGTYIYQGEPRTFKVSVGYEF